MAIHGSMRLISALAVLAAIDGLSPVGARAALDLVVDDDGAECTGATHTSIQAAVDAVPANGDATITVCAGSYDEFVGISSKGVINLVGVGAATITPPGPSGDGRLLDVEGVKRILIQGLTLDGNGEFSGAASIRGIRVSNSPGRIVGNTVRNIHNATPDAASAIGILVSDLDASDGKSKWTIAFNVVDGYGAVGILAQGAGGNATVIGNEVTGIGTSVAPFNDRFAIGIDVQLQARARIQRNTISQNWYAGPGGFVSPGIYLYEESKVLVSRNTLEENQAGIWVDSCCDGFASTKNRVSSNAVSEAEIGILVEVANVEGATLVVPVNSQNQISRNTLSTTVPSPTSVGIWLANVDFDGPGVGIDPLLDRNVIGPNTVTGFVNPCIDQGTDTRTRLACSP
jgi:parallel beta-helix repeat protein